MANILPALPLVGRTEELGFLGNALANAGAGTGGAVFLRGTTGIGKSRLAVAAAEEANRLGLVTVRGQAYKVETGIPYGLWSNAFLPVVREMDASALSVRTRGGEGELVRVVPALGSGAGQSSGVGEGEPGELQTRIHWNFTEFLRRLGERKPVLVVLDDVHWSDPSGLDLLHFATRHLDGSSVLVVCTYNVESKVENPGFEAMETALVSVQNARVLDVGPISAEASGERIRRVFDVEPGISDGLAARIHGRTGGNPYFVGEILKALVDSGSLYLRGGTWLGWEVDDLDLPDSVGAAVAARLGELSPAARQVAHVLAVAGTSATHELFGAVADLEEDALLGGIDELRAKQLVEESAEGSDIVYRFSHPLIQEVLYSEIGLARARSLHRTVGEALERGVGSALDDRTHQLAHHFSLAGGNDTRVIRYLSAAGREALSRRADREAVAFLGDALSRVAGDGGDGGDGAADLDVLSLREDLARALQRSGDYGAAAEHWQVALALTLERGEGARAARLHGRIGQGAYFRGHYEDALAAYELGLERAVAAKDPVVEAHLRLHKGNALQSLGRAKEAQEEMETALELAESVSDPGLLARVHRGLMILYTYLGNPEKVREHGREAIPLSRAAGDAHVTYWVYWQLAVLEGFLGYTETMEEHIHRCQELAEELRSPVLELWTAEIFIEHAASAGRWDTGIALGERAVAKARVLGQEALLPRLLVFLSLIYLGRGEIERGKACVDEAWERSGAAVGDMLRVHLVVPAHIGKAAYHVAEGEYEEAIRVGEEGLAIAENSGFIVWAVHRLLPLILEAYVMLDDAPGAAHIEQRLNKYGQRMGNRLAMAWSKAFEGIKVWHAGDIEGSTVLLGEAAEALEALPMIFDGARVRRQLAGRLADLGDREGALRELRHVHDAFLKMKAEGELQKTRVMFRELDVRPPSMSAGVGAGGLTRRELEIVRLVAMGRSDKAVAKELDIARRTVSTHLSNMYRKLELGSRGELVAYVAENNLLAQEQGG